MLPGHTGVGEKCVLDYFSALEVAAHVSALGLNDSHIEPEMRVIDRRHAMATGKLSEELLVLPVIKVRVQPTSAGVRKTDLDKTLGTCFG